MNTKWTVEYISYIALKETCDKMGIEYEERPTCIDLKFSRYEMDENGYHVGYGTWIVRLRIDIHAYHLKACAVVAHASATSTTE